MLYHFLGAMHPIRELWGLHDQEQGGKTGNKQDV